RNVTGVQTCALPISPLLRRRGLAEPVATDDDPAAEPAAGPGEPGDADPAAANPAAVDDPATASAGAAEGPKQHANHAKVETALRSEERRVGRGWRYG